MSRQDNIATPRALPPTRGATEKKGAPTDGGQPSRVTPEYVFQRSVERARNLLKLHEAAHGKAKKPEKYLSDAHRAALVLSISALDAYVRTYVLERIRERLLDRKSELPPKLSEKIKGFLKEDGLLEAARHDNLIQRVEKAFRSDFEKNSYQGVRAITAIFQLVGINDVFKEVASKAGENEESLKSRLDKFTGRRHEIAHKGDYNLSENPPRESPITKRDASECISLVCLIARTIEVL